MADAAFEVCFNRFSMLDCEREDAFKAFLAALRGMKNVYNKMHKDCERAFIYYDIVNPHNSCYIAYNYSLKDALLDVEKVNPDLYDFFMFLATQAPFINHIDSSFFDLLSWRGFVAGKIGGRNAKIFYFALLTNAYVLSMPCEEWNSSTIPCYGYNIFSNKNNSAECDEIVLKNICLEYPSFIPKDNGKTVKKFCQGDCNIYVYFFDHAPPHVHARHNNEWCAIIKIQENPELWEGNIPKALKGKIIRYLRDNFDSIRESWDELNPSIHG